MAVTNYNLADIQKMFDLYYSNYFFDNKEILNYMTNFNKDGGDDFEKACKKILKLDFKIENDKGFFIEKTTDAKTPIKNTTIYNNTTDIIIAIKIVTNILYDIIKESEGDIYNKIQIIQLYNEGPSDTNIKLNKTYTQLFKQHDAATVFTKEQAEKREEYVVSYIIDGGILKIYNMKDIRPYASENCVTKTQTEEDLQKKLDLNYIFSRDKKMIEINNQTYQYII